MSFFGRSTGEIGENGGLKQREYLLPGIQIEAVSYFWASIPNLVKPTHAAPYSGIIIDGKILFQYRCRSDQRVLKADFQVGISDQISH